MSEKKKEVATKEAKKMEFKMEQVFAMWKNQGKNGKTYFTGKHGDVKLIGFYNTTKKNPKEPDIRVYELNQDGELTDDVFVSLWCNVSANGKKYLSGKLDDKRLVGFINTNASEKQPYFSVYYSDDAKKPEKKESGSDFVEAPKEEDLPF